MVVAVFGLEDMISHFTLRRRYRVDGRWTWQMRREYQLVTGRGDYIHGTSRYNFFNAGVS